MLNGNDKREMVSKIPTYLTTSNTRKKLFKFRHDNPISRRFFLLGLGNFSMRSFFPPKREEYVRGDFLSTYCDPDSPGSHHVKSTFTYVVHTQRMWLKKKKKKKKKRVQFYYARMPSQPTQQDRLTPIQNCRTGRTLFSHALGFAGGRGPHTLGMSA